MHQTIFRYEFAPFNIGINLSIPKLKKIVIDTLCEFGWVDISGIFDTLEYESVANQTIGVYQKDDTWIFVPENGFFVARYAFELSAESLFQVATHSLLQRVALHKSVALTGTHDVCIEVQKLAEQLKLRLSKYTSKSYRISNSGRLHEYVFSVYAIYGTQNIRPIKQALLCPRDFGCSSSVPDCQMPTFQQVLEKIQSTADKTHDDEQYAPLVLRNQKLHLYSSWSSVVVQELEPCQGIDLVSLCEFRIQSIWLAGLYAQRFANNINLSTLSVAQYSALNNVQQNLKRLTNQHKLKLGPNAPPDPTRIMAELSNTSDVLKELKNADDALTYAINQGGYTLDERNATSRKMLEVFSLIFASSSLAPILLPTPLDLKTISEHTNMFIAWLTLTLIGVYFVIKQR